MRAQIPREPLLGALQVAQSVVGGGGADRTVAQDVRITAGTDGIRLRATDYELGVRLVVPESEVMEEGDAVVPVARLVKILREAEDPSVLCFSDDAHLKIELATARYTVNGVAPEEFPEFPEPEAKGGITLPAAELRTMVRRTQYAAATERSRYTLNGVRWEGVRGGLRLVATDGRRLAMVEHKTDGGTAAKVIPPAIVPLKATAVLEKVLAAAGDGPVTCKIVDNRIAVSAGDTHFSALLLEGQYPEYEQVIREPGAHPTPVEPAALMRAVRQAMPLTEDESRAVEMEFKKGRATLSARLAGAGGGQAEVEVEIDFHGDDMKIAFDSMYLRDALRALGSTPATLDLAGPKAAAVLRTEDGFTNVIMPITLPGA